MPKRPRPAVRATRPVQRCGTAGQCRRRRFQHADRFLTGRVLGTVVPRRAAERTGAPSRAGGPPTAACAPCTNRAERFLHGSQYMGRMPGTFRSGFSKRVPGMTAEESRSFLAELDGFLRSPRCTYQHRWQSGDLLLINNQRTMHGRTPISPDGIRLLWRGQVAEVA
ncbi:TauD/TfdA family dioxygenase [Streptomyces flavidovirens]|uniref:TauD/TfdA dioxygenase family protein n=1 Tax=Streptomyces flavidovirens TaxID=67298 RepID=UPI00344A7D76